MFDLILYLSIGYLLGITLMNNWFRDVRLFKKDTFIGSFFWTTFLGTLCLGLFILAIPQLLVILMLIALIVVLTMLIR